MTIRYVDYNRADDTGDGLSWATAKKTLTGISGVVCSAGDEVRVAKSPDPVDLGISATWTNHSSTVTLASALTKVVDNCEVAWTNVACTSVSTNTTVYKQGTRSSSFVVPASVVSGTRMAYKTITSADYSGYTGLSFYIANTVATADNKYSLRLCSDALGVTTVNTILIPSLTVCPATNSQGGSTIYVPYGAALGSNIQSVALYAEATTVASTLYIDCIHAANANFNYNTMIGRPQRAQWVANTSYNVNDLVRPTASAYCHMYYKCVSAGTSNSTEPDWDVVIDLNTNDNTCVWQCMGYDEFRQYYRIQSIADDGVTIRLDGGPTTTPTQTTYAEFYGTGGSYRLWCIQPFITVDVATVNVISQTVTTTNILASANNPLIVKCGYNTVSNVVDGETWYSSKNGMGFGIRLGAALVCVKLYGARFAMYQSGLSVSFSITNSSIYVQDIIAPNNETALLPYYQGTFKCVGGYSCTVRIFQSSSGGNSRFYGIWGMTSQIGWTDFDIAFKKDNNSFIYGCQFYNFTINAFSVLSVMEYLYKVKMADNMGLGDIQLTGVARLKNCTFGSSTEVYTIPHQRQSCVLWSKNHDDVPDSLFGFFYGGLITRTATPPSGGWPSGITKGWKVDVTNATDRTEIDPIDFIVASFPVTSGVPVTVGVNMQRNNAGLTLKAVVKQFAAGNLTDVVGTITSAGTNAWERVTVTFTPAETCVVDLYVQAYGGSTYSGWVAGMGSIT
jgi:hypothetical protein